jgi:hypothetical protein
MIRAGAIDGLDVPFAYQDERMGINIELEPRQSRTIELLDHPLPSGRAVWLGPVHGAEILARRVLFEFRDNTLSRHRTLLRAATGFVRRLR